MDATKVRMLADKLAWYRDGINQLERGELLSDIRIVFTSKIMEEIKHTTIDEELESFFNDEFDSIKTQLLDRLKAKAQYIEQDIAAEVAKK